MLLILTSEKDLAADFLIVTLIERGLPYVRLNVEEYHRRFATFEVSGSGTMRTLMAHDGTVIDLNEIRAVWYRRAIHPHVDAAVPLDQRMFVAGEERHFWAGLFLSTDVRWVNPIDKVSVGELKLVQLHLAQDLGFHVPRTIVTRNVAELRSFIVETGSAICKPIYHGLLVNLAERSSAFTRRITLKDLDDEAAISVSPVLFQAEVRRKADIRVTVVGDAIFAVRIECNDEQMIDWRKPGYELIYSTMTLQDDTAGKCRRMLAAMGLAYGAFDFIEEPSGRLVFLEVNPTGEWAWLEDKLDLPMRAAFIRLFYGEHA
ncbi:MvdC/MvdD family ATP grasp protein [Rhodanobacter sp. C05]|uniref:MvdC/MvdD family ATP grasp protein n=1 Tax=Rhodanobacter sp. C05 TaxID=1945855 RepID=UPI000986CAB9|nr:hypothetical protein [Rhodanobacter sp. C05]OOG38252.1 hypothetical protein B0E51_15600 [Rhodanobacter sp. C05]